MMKSVLKTITVGMTVSILGGCGVEAVHKANTSAQSTQQTNPTTKHENMQVNELVQEQVIPAKTEQTPIVSELSQEEADKKLDEVAKFQYGEAVDVKNKPNETHLYEKAHYKQALYKQVLGVWQGIKDPEKLKMMGLNAQQIETSKVEIGFMPDHDMQMRTFGMPAPEDTPFIKTNDKGVTVMTGRYIIKEGQIVIYFGRDAMENQHIRIDKDVLTLAPISDESFKLKYKKVADWSLKAN